MDVLFSLIINVHQYSESLQDARHCCLKEETLFYSNSMVHAGFVIVVQNGTMSATLLPTVVYCETCTWSHHHDQHALLTVFGVCLFLSLALRLSLSSLPLPCLWSLVQTTCPKWQFEWACFLTGECLDGFYCPFKTHQQ